MRLFHPVTYETALSYCGQQTELVLKNGKRYHGYVREVRPDGILFHSSNPGLLFLPFAAIALLVLAIPFAAAAGYGVGRRAAYPYPRYRYY